MQGFKSFVDNTTLDFESGISAIVGPNGCGKSNIVDAIRWVLGEMSAKALRGARMEDVIFNGTDQRKAVGMAEVSLTIDNHDRQLPTEHDEVMITRRTFRSGESEYLMNKTPCRLRDIHDLFMDTGIGTNSYSILEQGKIDLIVSSRPADRRFVFEEAAGISKYKARKEESLRKLESTEQNLLRVNDIAVEVRRQIGSLERQVQKARRFQEFKQELTTLEVSQGRRDLKERRRQLRKLEQRWEALRLEIEKAEGGRRHTEETLAGLNSSLAEDDTRVTAMQASVHRIVEEVIKSEDFVSASLLRKNDITITVQRLQAEVDTLLSKETQLRTRNAGTLEARQQKENELGDHQTQLAAEENRLNEVEQTLKARAAHVQDQQSRLLQIVDQMSSLRGALKNLEERQNEQQRQVDKLDQQLRDLSEQTGGVRQENQRLQTEYQDVKTQLANLEQERGQLENEQEKLEHVVNTLSAMLENFNATNLQLTSRLTWIEELKNGLDGYASGAKTILLEQNANPERFPGILGPMANFIRTDQKYEFAFEAWLGTQLQHILVETSAQARTALDFLAGENRGRATFIPLESVPETKSASMFSLDETPAWLDLPGTLGWAKDLARIDERFRAVFERCLDQVALVTDRDAARQARAAGADCILVTLQGEIETQVGWLTGGSTDIMERGLLGREREIAELKNQLAILENNLKETQAESEKSRRQLEETSGSLTAVNEDRHEAEIRSAQMEKDLESVTAQLLELEKQQHTLKVERAAVREAWERSVAEHEAVAGQLLDLEVTDRQTQETLTQHQEEIEDLRREYDHRSLQAGELRVAAAAVEQQLNSLKSETSRVTQELEEISGQKSEKQEGIHRDQDRLAQIDDEIKSRQAGLESLVVSQAASEQDLTTLQQSRGERTAEKHQREREVRELQATLDSLRGELHQQELEKTRQKMTLKNLEAYLEEEYSLQVTLEEGGGAEEPGQGEDLPDPEITAERVKELKAKIIAMGSVNLVAMEEYDELQERYTFLSKQLEDLKEAKEKLQKLITKINHESRERFVETFDQVRTRFKEVFRRLFNGGDADLVLIDESNLLETGIDIIARPPGKRLQNISLLSGGEKALTATALLFAIFLIKPSPFCIFDEMDAPLDDTNTLRFCRILQEFAKKSQFIVITHNKLTMEIADILYGVTMQESGVSRLISVKFKGDEEARTVSSAPRTASQEVALNSL